MSEVARDFLKISDWREEDRRTYRARLPRRHAAPLTVDTMLIALRNPHIAQNLSALPAAIPGDETAKATETAP